CQQDYSWPPTF
nr:immunoglobulin light chain junction region [Macaca mulatta]